jgi:hypothetical protein
MAPPFVVLILKEAIDNIEANRVIIADPTNCLLITRAYTVSGFVKRTGQSKARKEEKHECFQFCGLI